ncbi:MAG: hypothetical protein ACFFD1_10245 [Candidatus Thorarchaeota archaeon]
MLDLIINLLYALYLGIQLITCIFLMIRTIKIKQLSLIPLVLFFFFNPLELILIFLTNTSLIVNMLSNICLVIFTKVTFYRERKSAFIYLLIALIIVKIIDFMLKLYIPFSIPLNFIVSPLLVPYYYLFLVITSSSIILSYPWLSIAALKYYNKVKVREIEPWVKFRYKLIGYSTLIISLNGLLYLFIPIDTYNWERLDSFIIGLLIIINTTIFSIANLIAWLMPQILKNYLNRNYQGTIEQNLTEEEIMNKIREDTSKKT